MKRYKRKYFLLFALIILTSSYFSKNASGIEYPGSSVEWTTGGLVMSQLYVPDNFQLVNLDIAIDDAYSSEGISHCKIYLISPIGTFAYLFGSFDLSGDILLNTKFDDSASKSIAEGVSPYIGSYRPIDSFAIFNGEWSNGTWRLAIQSINGISGNTGSISDWSLFLNEPTPIPSPTPTPQSVPENIGIFRDTSGLWAIQDVTRVYFGSTGDEAVLRDYNGDGIKDIAVFRPSSGLWAIRGVTRVYFGSSLDTPFPIDMNGDGCCDIGIFRESSGLWAIRGITRSYFGSLGDTPVKW